MASPRLACAVPEAPSGCPRCGSIVREDSDFTLHANFYDLPQRRYVCAAGHSVYSGLTAEAVKLTPAGQSGRPPTPRACRYCGAPFQAITQAKFCSKTCSNARHKELERARGVMRRKRPTFTSDGLRRIREIRMTRSPRNPVPYAVRPKGLSTAWV